MNPSWMETLGWALLHCLWQISILAFCYRAAEPLLRDRPRLSYLSGVTLLALSLIVVGSTLALQRTPTPADADIGATTLARSQSVVAARLAAAAPPAPASMPSSGVGDRIATVLENYLSVTVLVWMGGILFVGFRFARAYESCQKLCESSAPVTSRVLIECLARAKRQLGVRRDVDVRWSTNVDSPVLIGWLRPTIILPVNLERALSTEQILSVMAHELAHVKRWDYPVNLVQMGIERLFFFNPAVRWLSREIRLAREHCCDDLAAATSRDGALGYARCLVRLEEFRTTSAIALGLQDGDFVRRIERLLSTEAQASRQAASRPWALAATGPLGALLAAGLLLLGGVWVAQASTMARTVLGGLDPVYLVEGLEVEGDAAFSLHSGRYRYLFADRDSLERFRRSPERYSVRNTDFCPVTGKAVQPDVWRLVDGRPVLFCCDSVPEALLPRAQLARVEPKQE